MGLFKRKPANDDDVELLRAFLFTELVVAWARFEENTDETSEPVTPRGFVMFLGTNFCDNMKSLVKNADTYQELERIGYAVKNHVEAITTFFDRIESKEREG